MNGNPMWPVSVGTEPVLAGTAQERFEVVVRFGSARRQVVGTYQTPSAAYRRERETLDALAQSFDPGSEIDVDGGV